MRLSLTLDCVNAAFCEHSDPASEIGRILSKAAAKIALKQTVAIGDKGELIDANGNKVGAWKMISTS